MARRFWPGQDPLGRRFKYGLDPGANRPWKTVVGVVADMRRQRLDEPAIPYMFQPGVIPQMDIAVRTAGDPERVARRDPRRDARASIRRCRRTASSRVEQRLGRTVALRRLQTHAAAGAGGGRADAGGDRRLRRHPPVGGGPHAGDRRPHGARRRARQRCCGWCSPAGWRRPPPAWRWGCWDRWR